jgi:hypothetical protein
MQGTSETKTKSWYQTTDGTVQLYAAGLCYASACAPADMPREEVERRVRAMDDAGTSHGWTISTDEKFQSGHANPCPCDQVSDRTHWLLCC